MTALRTSKELRPFVAALVAEGFVLEEGANHLRAQHPETGVVFTFAGKVKSRTLQNVKMDVRKTINRHRELRRVREGHE